MSRGGRRRRVLLVSASVLAILALGATTYLVWLLIGLPSIEGLDAAKLDGDTIIQDRTGAELADLGREGGHRVSVPLDAVSPKLVQATVAIEDPSFWSNPGLDPIAMLSGHQSSISLQLARQRLGSPRQKVREATLAVQLNRSYSKSQILELYLNQSYFGSQLYGIQAAAQGYFHRDARNLDLAQSAMLAGILVAPSGDSPRDHFDRARGRQRVVLDAMVRSGYVRSPDADAAARERLDVFPASDAASAPGFVAYVESELERLGLGGRGQVVVRTSLDPAGQALAEQVVADAVRASQGGDASHPVQGALVAIDPRTGQIAAFVGSAGPSTPLGAYDYASGVPRSPGTALQVLAYARAIADHKLTMDTPLADGPSPFPITIPGALSSPYQVQNFDGQSHGTLRVREALASGLNIPAVQVELAVGVPALVDFYRAVGLRPRINGITDAPSTLFGPSLTLGGYPVTALEQVAAASTLADLGVYRPPEAILQVTDRRGRVLYRADPSRGTRRAVDAGAAFIIASILSDDANRALTYGAGSPLHLSDRRSAAVSGRSDTFRDATTIGFTPDLAAVVWIGDVQLVGHGSPDAPLTTAAAWNRFMEGALGGLPDTWYEPPPDVVQRGSSYFLSGTGA